MSETTVSPTRHNATRTWSGARAGWRLFVAVFRGSTRDRRGLIPSFMTPLVMLIAYWLSARAQPETMASLFAACVALSAIMSGSTHTTRLVSWREQGVLQRLACTPVPIPFLIAGIGLAQVALGLLQALAIVLFGALVLGIQTDPEGILLAVVGLGLGATCFVAYGSIIAQIPDHSEGANALFIFSVLPMFFLGGGVPPSLLPPNVRVVGALTPMGMMTALVEPIMGFGGEVSDGTILAIAGLAAYTLVFLMLASRMFRLE